MADSYLTSGEYMKIADSWRPEWDVAVQIPRSARKRALKIAEIDPCRKQKEDFRLEDHFSSTGKCLRCSGKKLKMANGGVEKPRKASELYDIDLIDSAWLTSMNETRRAKGDDEIDSALFEIVMEYLELLAQRNVVQLRKKRKKRGGALTNGSSDLDQNVCDVCRAETEDLNYARCASCSTLVHCACKYSTHNHLFPFQWPRFCESLKHICFEVSFSLQLVLSATIQSASKGHATCARSEINRQP